MAQSIGQLPWLSGAYVGKQDVAIFKRSVLTPPADR